MFASSTNRIFLSLHKIYSIEENYSYYVEKRVVTHALSTSRDCLLSITDRLKSISYGLEIFSGQEFPIDVKRSNYSGNNKGTFLSNTDRIKSIFLTVEVCSGNIFPIKLTRGNNSETNESRVIVLELCTPVDAL